MTFPIDIRYTASVMNDYFSNGGELPPQRVHRRAAALFDEAIKARESLLGGDIGSYCTIAEALRSVHGREDIPRAELDQEMRALRGTCANLGVDSDAAKKEHFPMLKDVFAYILKKADEQAYDKFMSGSWG